MQIEVRSASPEQNVITAARMCYQSIADEMGDKDQRLIKRLLKSKHLTPFENCSVFIIIKGISRVCLAQLTRHRHASYCVKSQRYCKEENFEYYIPEKIKGNPELKNVYKEFMSTSQKLYDYLISEKIKPEDARYILPGACDTYLTMSINLSSLFNFIRLRTSNHAQKEIRDLANMIKYEVAKHYPIIMSVFNQLEHESLQKSKVKAKKLSLFDRIMNYLKHLWEV